MCQRCAFEHQDGDGCGLEGIENLDEGGESRRVGRPMSRGQSKQLLLDVHRQRNSGPREVRVRERRQAVCLGSVGKDWPLHIRRQLTNLIRSGVAREAGALTKEVSQRIAVSGHRPDLIEDQL